jgi:S-adenosylmethionine:tRNA ribosyltransferase-isomerase
VARGQAVRDEFVPSDLATQRPQRPSHLATQPPRHPATLSIHVDVAEFDFNLPDELIAQEPPPRRGQSRLLVLDRRDGRIEHAVFAGLPRLLHRGDVLVVNDTRVFPARLLGRRVPSGGAVECLLVERTPEDPSSGDSPSPPLPSEVWSALMHPGQKLKPGARVLFEGDGLRLHGQVLERHFFGRRRIRLWSDEGAALAGVVDRIGHIPLPPYIKRDDRPADRDRYQTVYAHARGSIAAPTAGLHFTGDLLAALAVQGVERLAVTLHVGYGTFKPVRAASVEEHEVDPEHFTVNEATAAALTRARLEGRRIVAVGTTTARALESLPVRDDGTVEAASGATRLFIRPGHRFRLIDGLVTNFHLPKSSLLMLVAAFGGLQPVMAAYREAVEQRYRFYSYGDAMLVI